MAITVVARKETPDSNYFSQGEVSPYIEGDGVVMVDGYGKRGKGRVSSLVIVSTDDFVAIHMDFFHKYGNGRGYYYFVREGGAITRKTWGQLPDARRQLVLDWFGTGRGPYVKAPGKLKAQGARREGGDTYYKAVAVTADGRYVSIFDGETEYRLGETLRERAGQGHSGGYYAYATVEAARQAVLPRTSALLDAPRVILRVRGAGAYCRYDNDKLSFSELTPVAVAEVVADEYDAYDVA